MMVCILEVYSILSGVVSGVVERRGVHKRPLKGTQKEPERFPASQLLHSLAPEFFERKPSHFPHGSQIGGLVTCRRTKADNACGMNRRQI